jgi:hypothetical protein
VDENVWSVIAANEAVTFGVVEPLHCSLFCHDIGIPFNRFTLERFGGLKADYWLLGESCSRPIRSNAVTILRATRTIRNPIPRAIRNGHDLGGIDVPQD